VNKLTDQELLRDYARRRSETAFAELVRRHADHVYSAVLRMVRDGHLAEDVTQGVFIAFAGSARALTDHPVLSGWLHRTAQNLAAKAVRSEVRRRVREEEVVAMTELFSAEPDAAWEQITPQLDAALGELNEADRDAIFLRFFERKSAREIARSLGTSEEAAQKRVSRAVESLRELLAKRGVRVGAGGLVVVLSANAVQAAPAALVAALSGAALASATPGAATPSILKLLAATKLNSGVLSAIVIASVLTPVLAQRQAQARLGGLDQLLQQQGEQMAQLSAENEHLSNSSGRSIDSGENARLDELLELRGEAGSFRRQTKDLATLREENRRLRPPESPAPRGLLQSQELGWARQQSAQGWARAFIRYARANQGRLPDGFAQAEPYWPTNQIDARQGTGVTSDQFEILYHGTLDSLTNVSPRLDVILFREKQLWPNRYGRPGRFVALANGFAQAGSTDVGTPNESFSDWEKAHMAATYTANE
jgi:RNA polymerase sigma factor (sigma-70 family)